MDRKKIVKWFECDYLPRVGAYRKDCKQGCDACMTMHDSDDYCDIDMLCKVLALLKEQPKMVVVQDDGCPCCPTCGNELYKFPHYQKYCDECGQAVKWND